MNKTTWMKSSTRENDAIKRCSEWEMYETTAGLRRHTVLQQTLFIFLLVERVNFKIMIKCTV